MESVFSANCGYDLHGILCEPDSGSARDIAVVFVNSGIMHKVGTCRTAVLFARALAEIGIASARFDFSGIGDTPAATGGVEESQRNVVEVQAVLDWLSDQRPLQRFVLFGLCAGARAAVQAGADDERVCGIFCIDNAAYPTARFERRRWQQKLSKPGFYAGPLKQPLKKLMGREVADTPVQNPDFQWSYPPREEMQARFITLAKRNVKNYQLYTGSWLDQFNYPEQFREMYPDCDFGDTLEVRLETGMSHIMAEPSSQALVEGELLGWIERELA